MAKDNFLIIREFDRGWFKRIDDTRIPLGGAQESVNITLTDRGGISPMPGQVLLGTSESGSGIKSLYSFKKTSGPDILMKTFDDKIKYFNNVIEDWALLQDGYQSSYQFGLREHTTSADALDWIYFGNSIDPYSRL